MVGQHRCPTLPVVAEIASTRYFPPMPSFRGNGYRALLIDLDGTLLDDEGVIRPRNLEALRGAQARGVHLMVATGRSVPATLPAVAPLELTAPLLAFNGAVIWCPAREQALEERILSNRTVAQALRFGAERGYLTFVQRANDRWATPPATEEERAALAKLEGLNIVPRNELPDEYVIRVSWISDRHASSRELGEEVAAAIDQPIYSTDFPISVLSDHRASSLVLVDIHPPCRGKAEGLRFLEESYGIAPAEVVAIGDATNDVEMLRGAGLGVAVGSGMKRAREVADRVIGGNDTDAIGELVGELFGG